MKDNLKLQIMLIFLAAIFGIITSFATSCLTNWFFARDPVLFYSTPETIPFKGTNNVVAIYQTMILNEGKSFAEEVDCTIRIPATQTITARIEEVRISKNPSIKISKSMESDTLKLNIPILNQNEQVTVLGFNL